MLSVDCRGHNDTVGRRNFLKKMVHKMWGKACKMSLDWDRNQSIFCWLPVTGDHWDRHLLFPSFLHCQLKVCYALLFHKIATLSFSIHLLASKLRTKVNCKLKNILSTGFTSEETAEVVFLFPSLFVCFVVWKHSKTNFEYIGFRGGTEKCLNHSKTIYEGFD